MADILDMNTGSMSGKVCDEHTEKTLTTRSNHRLFWGLDGKVKIAKISKIL